MIFRLLADLLVVGHLAFIVFVGAGGFLALRRPRFAFLHLPLAAWGAFVELSGRICPLTPWEVHLRRLGGEAGYAGGFIDHYLLPVLYPSGLSRGHQIGLGILVILLNLCVYGWVVGKKFRCRSREAGPGPDSSGTDPV